MTTASEIAAATSLTEAPALVVFGRDEGGKPHASWFDEADAPLAGKAAAMMGMASLTVAAYALRELAGRLPQGKVFASGRAFVPFVKGATFEALASHLPPDFVWPDRQAVEPAEAGGAGEDTDREAGGVERDAAGNADGRAAGEQMAAAEQSSAVQRASPSHPVRPGPKFPADWSKIEVGSMVLACEGEGEGWFEAQVVKIKGDGLYVLRWRDWLDYQDFVRRRAHVALIHPKHAN